MFNRRNSDGSRRSSFTKRFFSRIPDLRTDRQRYEDSRVFEDSLTNGQLEAAACRSRSDVRVHQAS